MSRERRIGRIRAFGRSLTPQLLWDFVMVYLAILNLGLILFDLTYLWLRPFYFRHVPSITRIYDPVKGIEPEPLTAEYLERAADLSDHVAAGAPPAELEVNLAELRSLSVRMLEENSFERSGLERTMIRSLKEMQRYLREEPGASSAVEEMTADEGVQYFWSLQPDPRLLAGRVEFFEANAVPLLEVNFYRSYELSGHLTDNFWKIDLPFLLVFATEFFVGWFLSVRRGTYNTWFLYPLFHWYDLLGIIPLKQFRLFRLFRVASIYIRLHQSEYSKVGDDIISRTVKYFANIISEEISDMVSLRILNETQSEIRGGTHRKIIHSVASTHRDALSRELANQLQDLMTNEEVREQARVFLDANLQQSVDSAEALRRVPLPDVVLRPLVVAVGQTVFNAFADTLAATLASDEGHAAVEALISDTVDGLVVEMTEGELEEIVTEISLQVIDHVKDAVAVRKWAYPHAPPRSVFTEDMGS
jgi:hypothetical protein